MLWNKFICREGEGNAAGGTSGGTANGGASATGAGNPPPGSSNNGGTGNGTASTATTWVDALSPELKGFAENKGFKEPSMVLESYRNLEKLQGVPPDRLLKLPEKPDDAEWANVYKRLGRPDKPEDYKLKPGDESESSKAFVDWAQKTFMEAGLSTKQAETLAAKWNEQSQNYIKQADEAATARLQEQQKNLKKEWGAAYDHQMKVAKEAAHTFGLTPDQVDGLEKVLGYDGIFKHLYAVGSKLGEGEFVSNSSGGGKPGFNAPMSPAAAQDRIAALKGDQEFGKKYSSGDFEAKQTMDRLHKWAYPETAE